MNIYESIFDFFLHGKIAIFDNSDLIQNFPIVGNEKIEIILGQEDKNVILDFRLYKIDRDTKTYRGINKKKVFILYFVSEEQIKCGLNRISRRFEDKPENIISTCLTKILQSEKKFNFESTKEKREVYSNFWTFSKLVEFLSRISLNNKFSDYIFYENFDGFNFESLSSLMMKPKESDIVFKNDNDKLLQTNNIKKYRMNKYFDILSNINLGMYGNRYYKLDPIYHEFKITDDDFTDIQEKIASLGNHSLFDKELSSDLNHVSENLYQPEISSARTISKKLLENYNFVMKLNGYLDRKVGQVVSIKFPNLDNESLINKSFDGNYLIMEINHIIDQDRNYEQNIMACKNSFLMNDSMPKISKFKNGGG
jgi:hypothetical protein